MPDPDPVILAAYLQANLRFLKSDPVLGQRVMRRFSESSLHVVESAWRLEWLAWDYVVEATEALYEAAGSEPAMVDFARRSIAATLEEPFFRPIVRGGLAILGRSPERMARWIPTMWKAISRNAGKLAWSADGTGSGTLTWEGAPAAAFDNPIYLKGVVASFLPVFDLADTPGRIHPKVCDDVVVFSFEWEAG